MPASAQLCEGLVADGIRAGTHAEEIHGETGKQRDQAAEASSLITTLSPELRRVPKNH
jgi:hypothetical protein